jgi:lipoprotein-anchoring transpeptidase ErfK/SrfK
MDCRHIAGVAAPAQGCAAEQATESRGLERSSGVSVGIRRTSTVIMGTSLRQATIAALAAALFAVVHPPTASAQLFWDWGGGNERGGSGREVVRFSPQFAPGEIIVSFGDRRLYFVTKPGEAISYPIAIPREEDRWQGVTNVSDKKVNPSWRPTADMLAENPRLPSWVPGGHPMNPLGVRALYLGSSTYRIHGTDAPWTIGTAVSKGCIRMYNRDVLDLYPRATIGAKVTVTWQHFTTSGDLAFPASDRPHLREMQSSEFYR